MDPSLPGLPHELLVEIALWLESFRDVLALRATCRSLVRPADDGAVWRALYARAFGVGFLSLRITSVVLEDWKMRFVQRWQHLWSLVHGASQVPVLDLTRLREPASADHYALVEFCRTAGASDVLCLHLLNLAEDWRDDARLMRRALLLAAHSGVRSVCLRLAESARGRALDLDVAGRGLAVAVVYSEAEALVAVSSMYAAAMPLYLAVTSAGATQHAHVLAVLDTDERAGVVCALISPPARLVPLARDPCARVDALVSVGPAGSCAVAAPADDWLVLGTNARLLATITMLDGTLGAGSECCVVFQQTCARMCVERVLCRNSRTREGHVRDSAPAALLPRHKGRAVLRVQSGTLPICAMTADRGLVTPSQRRLHFLVITHQEETIVPFAALGLVERVVHDDSAPLGDGV